MVKVVFYGTEQSGSNETELSGYVNQSDEIFISIKTSVGYNDFHESWICLDKATAIKFHRELKKQISFIQEGDENGN